MKRIHDQRDLFPPARPPEPRRAGAWEPFDDWDLGAMTPPENYTPTTELDVWFEAPERLWNAGKGIV
jgi:hypothetical protein